MNDAITGSVPQEIIDSGEDFMQTLEEYGSDLVRLAFIICNCIIIINLNEILIEIVPLTPLHFIHYDVVGFAIKSSSKCL